MFTTMVPAKPSRYVCEDCLGQGILLTKAEFDLIVFLSEKSADEVFEDGILDQQDFDYKTSDSP